MAPEERQFASVGTFPLAVPLRGWVLQASAYQIVTMIFGDPVREQSD
ncbi:hypothetical protein NAP1_00680 [Erythrobacter sp. NAP1]|nr:hypothetical protein NAP1_00680 [Erythrobacter sp. NAP1]